MHFGTSEIAELIASVIGMAITAVLYVIAEVSK